MKSLAGFPSLSDEAHSILLLHIPNVAAAAANGKKKRNNFNIFVNNLKHKKSISTKQRKSEARETKEISKKAF